MAARELTILFATVTGCSREVAERLEREARRRKFSIKDRITDLNSHLPVLKQRIESHLNGAELFPLNYLFVVSTTGQGALPDNMKVRFIK